MSDGHTAVELDAEVIRQQMEQTRSDLTEKFAELESQVAETIQSTGTAIDSTMSSIRGAVVNVRESLSLRKQIQQHPWYALGGSLAVGMLAEALMTKSTRPPKATNVRLLNPLPQSLQVPPPTLTHTLQGVIQNAAVQALPTVFNLLMQYWTAPREMPATPLNEAGDRNASTMAAEHSPSHASPVKHSPVNREDVLPFRS